MDYSIKESNLHNYLVVDKGDGLISDSSMEINDDIWISIKKQLKAKPEDNFVQVKNTKTSGSITYMRSSTKKGKIVLAASWNPQKWISGQNTLPAVGKGGELLMKLYEIVEFPFHELVRRLSGPVVEKITPMLENIMWSRLDLTTYTMRNGCGVDIAMVLDYFACVCQSSRRVNSGVSRSKLISVGEILNFTFDPYTNGEENISGVRFVKYATDKSHKLYSLSLYRKDAQLKSAAEFGAKIDKSVIKRVENRLRIEGQLYPDAFLRFKKSVELKKLMDVSGNVDPKGGEAYFKSSKFLKHSDAGISELKQCLSMMADNLYLHLLFNAWSDIYVVRRLKEIAGEDAFLLTMVGHWENGVDIQPTRVYRSNPKLMEKVRKFNLRIKEELGIDMREVPISVFTWIRKAIYESRFSEAEALEMAKLDMSGRNDLRLKELRSVGIARSKELASNLRGVQLISWSTEYTA